MQAAAGPASPWPQHGSHDADAGALGASTPVAQHMDPPAGRTVQPVDAAPAFAPQPGSLQAARPVNRSPDDGSSGGGTSGGKVFMRELQLASGQAPAAPGNGGVEAGVSRVRQQQARVAESRSRVQQSAQPAAAPAAAHQHTPGALSPRDRQLAAAQCASLCCRPMCSVI